MLATITVLKSKHTLISDGRAMPAPTIAMVKIKTHPDFSCKTLPQIKRYNYTITAFFY